MTAGAKAKAAMPVGPDVVRFFAEVRARLGSPDARPRYDVRVLDRFFAAVGRVNAVAEARQQAEDRVQAGRFNVFRLIEPDENRLSDIFADLLDPEGQHGQGDRFLRVFLSKLGIKEREAGGARWTVRREAATHGIDNCRRRIDILIEGAAMVAIENKVDSGEQVDQMKDYLEHLRSLCRRRGVPGILVYLTPNGRAPESLKPARTRQAQDCLLCWSYEKDLYEWLSCCRDACEAEKIRFFLSDLLAYIRSDLKRAPEPGEGGDDDER